MSDSLTRSAIDGIAYKGFVTVELLVAFGQNRQTERVVTTDSVAGLLVDEVNHRVLLVHQLRPAMERADNLNGNIVELTAGRFDVNLGPKALLVKEALEEAGVTLKEADVVLINLGAPMALSAGVLTELCYGAIAFIRPDQIAQGDEGYGVADEGENISRVWMPIAEFIDPSTRHDCWRVWAMAQYLARRRAEAELDRLHE